MRIEAYNMVNQVYKTNKPVKTTKSSQVYGRDQVQISGFGKDLQLAKQAVSESTGVREEVMAPIKASIDNGTYEVSNEDFASKLMEKFGL